MQTFGYSNFYFIQVRVRILYFQKSYECQERLIRWITNVLKGREVKKKYIFYILFYKRIHWPIVTVWMWPLYERNASNGKINIFFSCCLLYLNIGLACFFPILAIMVWVKNSKRLNFLYFFLFYGCGV